VTAEDGLAANKFSDRNDRYILRNDQDFSIRVLDATLLSRIKHFRLDEHVFACNNFSFERENLIEKE
jgi:hypothetical protein